MYRLIISLDYELFGNGAGNVMRDIIEPTDRILKICNKHNAKLSIMFEVAEYWTFKQYDNHLTEKLGYSPSKKMEQQVLKAVQQGHDVQLHIHPQWIGSEIDENGLWNLKINQWGIGYLPNKGQYKEDILSVTGALFRGKKTLEDLIQPINKNYKCTTFRAGGFLIKPEEHVIKAMKEVGLTIDSSVVKGMKVSKPVEIDYTNALDNIGYWWVDPRDVTIEVDNKDTIIECPIYSNMEPYYKNFYITKLLTTYRRFRKEKLDHHFNKKLPEYSSSYYPNKNIKNLLFKTHPMIFDFCKLSHFNMRKYLKKAMKRRPKNKLSVPIVIIGHSKDFYNDYHFSKFLDFAKNYQDIKLSTFSDIEEELIKDIKY